MTTDDKSSGLIPVAEARRLREAQARLTCIQSLLASNTDAREVAKLAAQASRELHEIADQLLSDAATVAVLNGMSGRQIGLEAGVRHDTVRRALSRSQTLSPYAEGEGRRRAVTTDGIRRARKALSCPR